MDLKSQDQEHVWLLRADLFFLDTEPPDLFYKATAEKLKQWGLTRQDTETILIYEVAPIAGANLGYLLWPVIGAWDGFERGALCSKIRAYVQRRAERPRWHYILQDWWMRWMVRELGSSQLLNLLE